MNGESWRSQIEVGTPDAMHLVGVALGRALRAGDLVLLTGELGAGKTTLTRGIGEGANVRGPVTSPTFVIARTHPSLGAGPSLVHVDAYRLDGAHEFDDLDIDREHSIVVAEWGLGLVQTGDHWLELTITRPLGGSFDDDWNPEEEPVETRLIEAVGYGSRWSEGMNWS